MRAIMAIAPILAFSAEFAVGVLCQSQPRYPPLSDQNREKFFGGGGRDVDFDQIHEPRLVIVVEIGARISGGLPRRAP